MNLSPRIFLALALVFLPVAEAGTAPSIIGATGKLSLLRLQRVGSRFGPASDSIDVEVVLAIKGHSGRNFGFQLRDGKDRPAHEGMLRLLQRAWSEDQSVSVNYALEQGKKNGLVSRVWLSRTGGPGGRPATPGFRGATGKLTYLRVHNSRSGGYGPPSDKLDGEIVLRLDSFPQNAFGLTLRNDSNRVAHDAMLDLLLEAYLQQWSVSIAYNLKPNRKNGTVVRLSVQK